MIRKTFIIAVACMFICLGGCAKRPTTTTNSVPNTTRGQNQKNDSVIVRTIPTGLPLDQILPTIIKAYKGRVVVIDFWATWCGPCMMAMKSIDPIKEKYLGEGKKVAFVYITGETSPMQKWQSTIPTIKGFHYRLTDKEWNGVCRGLGIRGIPCYYIADAKGNRVWDNLQTGGYPGDDVITAQIDDALNKK